MSAPILDSLKAMDTKLQETKSQDGKAHSKSKDDNPEKKRASDLESVDRFDREKLSCGFSGFNPWDTLYQITNTSNMTIKGWRCIYILVLYWFFEIVSLYLLLSLHYTQCDLLILFMIRTSCSL